MYIIDENSKEYRFGDHGPKYLMRGLHMNFVPVQLLPSQDLKAHLHNIMEKSFYVIEGEIDIMVDDAVHHLTPGQFIHIEPHETYYCINHYDEPVKIVPTPTPYQEVDKVEIENYTYDRK